MTCVVRTEDPPKARWVGNVHDVAVQLAKLLCEFGECARHIRELDAEADQAMGAHQAALQNGGEDHHVDIAAGK